MSEINTGGGAFPWCGDLNKAPYINLGLTARDFFAAQALPGIYDRVCMMLAENGERVANVYDIAATAAYEQADAMLRARGQS
jgi:hypothetical protein